MCMYPCYQQVLISVHLHLYPTTVVLSGDFSVFVRLTKTEKLSLADQFSKKIVMCMFLRYQQEAHKCIPSIISDHSCPKR